MYEFQTINSNLGIQFCLNHKLESNPSSHLQKFTVNVIFGNKNLTPQLLYSKYKNLNLQFLNQQHSTILGDPKNIPDICDGLTWIEPKYSAVIRTADCLPLIAYDHDAQQFTNLHCGRKGLVNGILNSFLKTCDPNHFFSFFIGPHIETYEIGLELYNILNADKIFGLTVIEGKYYFSLADFTKKFIASNFKKFNLYETHINTLLDPTYWSYRSDKMAPARNLSFAYIEEL